MTPPLTCDAGLAACGGSCVDLATSDGNCGSCGTACGATAGCAQSTCFPRACAAGTCSPNSLCASDQCVTRSCFGVECGADASCADGTCLPRACAGTTCGSGQVCSGNACVEAACVGVICPGSLGCRAGVCILDTCSDGMRNGQETDIDCGGNCVTCADGLLCSKSSDCASRACSASGTCATPTCTDGAKNGAEGDVDCGGTCAPCADGRRCSAATQCESHVCTTSTGTCAAPSCTDAVKNGLELDVDCGGSCGKCRDGQACSAPADCQSNRCTAGRCEAPTCSNSMKDGTETDVDCGGSCAGCADGLVCMGAGDCRSSRCVSGRCSPPTCQDQATNGTETDVDCGGLTCGPCGVGKGCAAAADCVSQVCSSAKTCLAPTCSDQVRNGSETDTDCGGATGCPKCGQGKACTMAADCTSNNCTANRCALTPYYGPTVELAAGSGPYGLAVGDIDADGKQDVVVANRVDRTVSIFWGNGDGSFVAPAQVLQGVSLNDGPRSVAIGDFDADGKKDIVSAGREGAGNGGCMVSVLRGAGSRMFYAVQPLIISQTDGCGGTASVARFNADGYDDLLLGNSEGDFYAQGGPATIWLGSASGLSVATGQIVALSPAGAMAVAVDVDRDAQLDVLVHHGVSNLLRYFRNAGNVTFPTAPASFGTARGDGEVVAGAINADSNVDVAVAATVGNASDSVGVYFGDGVGGFIQGPTLTAPGAFSLVLIDVDGDGPNDLLVTGRPGLQFFRNQGNGTFAPVQSLAPAIGNALRVRSGDFDGDGKVDVVALANGKCFVLRNQR